MHIPAPAVLIFSLLFHSTHKNNRDKEASMEEEGGALISGHKGFLVIAVIAGFVALWYFLSNRSDDDGGGGGGSSASSSSSAADGSNVAPVPSIESEGLLNDSTIAPGQRNVLQTMCECPVPGGPPVQGALSGGVIMGQSQHEGNDPYTFVTCQANAHEVLMLMQDEQNYLFVKDTTRADVGTYPPKQMFFTWDEEEKMCKFYFACTSLNACDKTSLASGVVIM